MTVDLDGSSLSINKLVNVARNNEHVSVGKDAWKRIDDCRKMLQNKIDAHEIMQFDIESARGKNYTVKLRRWNGLIIKGKNGIVMHDKPFDVVKVEVFDNNGNPVNYKNMWLMVAGERKNLIEVRLAWSVSSG